MGDPWTQTALLAACSIGFGWIGASLFWLFHQTEVTVTEGGRTWVIRGDLHAVRAVAEKLREWP